MGFDARDELRSDSAVARMFEYDDIAEPDNVVPVADFVVCEQGCAAEDSGSITSNECEREWASRCNFLNRLGVRPRRILPSELGDQRVGKGSPLNMRARVAGDDLHWLIVSYLLTECAEGH